MKVRPERFGAWVALDETTLVALDRPRARALGIDGGPLWNDAQPAPPPLPLEAHISVTSRCPMKCTGCYQNASPHGNDVPFETLERTLDDLASAGVFTVAFGGGEPLVRNDLPALARAARARGMTPVITTSGIGLTPERARTLRDFAQVNVSHDGIAGGYRAVRGYEGTTMADQAIATLVREGIAVGVNLVLTRDNFPHVEATAEHVRTLGARELQLLRYKPAGRAASIEYLTRRLTPEQSRTLYPLLARLSRQHGEALSVKIDCALVPFLSPYLTDVTELTRWGIFGCEAGRHLVAITQNNTLAPCSFAIPSASDLPDNQPWNERWCTDETLKPFRAFANAPPEPCASCPIHSVCRGGCKVVSEYLCGAMVPDPECPRVIAPSTPPTCPTDRAQPRDRHS